MDKIRKPLESNTANPAQAAPLSFSEEVNNFEFDDNNYNSKMKVECLCPKCGQRHVMAFHWIGRGTPRKYCPSCKGGSNG